MSFTLPQLPYAYEALEPSIDARTMEIHYTKHHKAYTDNLNNAIAGTPLEGKSIEDILLHLDTENKAVRNNGGGYYNHNLFWEILTPKKGTAPSEELAKALDEAFGSFEAFKTAFSKAAATQFGSGWAWLTVQKGGKVAVIVHCKPRQSADASCRWWYSHLRIGCMGTCLLPKLPKSPC